MSDCIFCQIVEGKIPAHKVYEDDLFLAFLDIKPFNPGHVILIPKNHHRWVYDIPEFEQFFSVAKKITDSQLKQLSPLFVTFLTMGMQVEHAHLHLIPRYFNDHHKEGIDTVNRLEFSSDELSNMASRIKL